MVCQNSNPFGYLSFRFEFIFVCSKNIMTSLKLFFLVSFEHLLQIRSFVEYMSILCCLFQTVLNRRG